MIDDKNTQSTVADTMDEEKGDVFIRATSEGSGLCVACQLVNGNGNHLLLVVWPEEDRVSQCRHE